MPSHPPLFVRAATIVAAVVLSFAPLARARAQHRFDGVWVVHYERVMRTLPDGETHVLSENARMILRLRGDSLFGSWEPIVEAGSPPRTPSSVRGTVRGDSMHVEVDAPPPDDDGFFSEMGRAIVQFLKTYVHGMPPMTPHLDALARGDSLVGVRGAVSADGAKTEPSRPMIATRPPR